MARDRTNPSLRELPARRAVRSTVASLRKEVASRVLVVEDDDLVRWRLGIELVDAGFDVMHVATAEDAIVELTEETSIRVIITDAGMPGTFDGFKLARLVGDRWPAVRIIVVSGQIVAGVSDLPIGAQFFSKPYELPQLIGAVRAYVNDDSARPV